MSTGVKIIPSGSTSGKPVKLTGTTSGGAVTFHTAVTGAASWDQMFISAFNTDTVDRTVTISWGDTSLPFTQTVPANGGLILVVNGMLLNGAQVVSAWASAANVVCLIGDINRIS